MDKKSKALDVLAEVSGHQRDKIEPDMDLVADLGIDSPSALQLLVALEEALSMEISDEEAAAMETVADILRFAESASG